MSSCCKFFVLPAGPLRVINIQAGTLRLNFAEEKDEMVVGVREGTTGTKVDIYRRVEILAYEHTAGQPVCDIVHTQHDPLPETDGRGVVYIRTNAPLRVWVDE